MESIVNILPYIQIILSVLIVLSVMLQKSDSSLGSMFGGGNDSGGIKQTRRGFEKFLFNGTIVLGILFILSSLTALLI